MQEVIFSTLYSKNDKVFASDILELYRELSIIRKTLLMYGIVDFETDQTTVESIDGQYIITISYLEFLNPRNAEATPIISENDSDFLLYKKIGEHYSNYIANLNLGVNLSHNLGAGSHSKTQFNRLSKLHPFLLCLVDNDKAHPEKGEGSTSSAFTPNDKAFNCGQVTKVIDVREVESLIPKFILKKVFEKATSEMIQSLDEINFLAEKNSDFRVYFDHKDGLTLKQAMELDQKYGDFWLPIIGKLDRFKIKTCFSSKVCTDCNNCPRILGLGESLLKRSNNEILITNPHKFKSLLEDDLRDFWTDIGFYIFSWGCTANTRVARA